MSRLLAIFKGLIERRVTIDYVDKTSISRTHGEVTNLGHN